MAESLRDLFTPGPGVESPSTDSDLPPAKTEKTEAESLAGLFVRKAPPPSGIGEKAVTVGKGVVAGVAQGAPVVAGAVMGGKLGAAAGAAGGPLAPVTVPAGAFAGVVIGAGAGYMFGQETQRQAAQVHIPWTDETLTFESMEAVPKHLRPYAVAGETFGQTLPFIAAPYMLARDGFRFAPNLTGRILNTMIEGAAQYPARFAASEIAMGASAGVGGGLAEALAPGNVWARMSGEIVGGFANPTRWAVAGYRLTARQLQRAVSSFSPAVQRNRAQQYLAELVETYGEDADALATALREADLPDVALTAGQKTESPALLALEARLVGESAQFGEKSRQTAENSLGALKQLIKLLEAAGDPVSLRTAAQARENYFSLLLNGRLRQAENRALEAAANIDASDIGAVSEYGRQTWKVLDEVIDEVRLVEKANWAKVDTKLPAVTDSIVAQYDSIRAERLPEESLPGIVEGFVRRTKPQDIVDEKTGKVIDQEIVEITTGELIRFRSRMLELAREAAGKNDWSDARVYGQLAEAALDDLDVAQITEPAYAAARQYSRQLNDVLTRTFAGKAMERAPTGAQRVPPELIMFRAFNPTGEVAELQFRQLQEAAAFAGQEHLSRMMGVQENMLRVAAKGTVDGMTGRVNPQRLAAFRRDHAELLQRFPAVAAKLEDAQSAEALLRGAIAGNTRAERSIKKFAAFSRLLDNESPVGAVGRVLSGANPRKEYTQLARLARKSGPDAVEGLASATFQQAYQRASTGARFSFGAYRKAFFEPISGGETLAQMMVREKIATKRGVELLDEFLTRAEAIERALEKRAPAEQIPDAGAAIYDFVLRVTGARAAAVAPTGGAHGLIVAHAGSRAARQVLDKLPQSRVREFLIEYSRNPEMMAAALESHATSPGKRKVAMQMNAFLWQSGIMQGLEEAGSTPGQ